MTQFQLHRKPRKPRGPLSGKHLAIVRDNLKRADAKARKNGQKGRRRLGSRQKTSLNSRKHIKPGLPAISSVARAKQ